MANYKRRKSQMAKNIKAETKETKGTPVVEETVKTAEPVKAEETKKSTVDSIDKKEPKAVVAPEKVAKTVVEAKAEDAKKEEKTEEKPKRKYTKRATAKKVKPEMVQEVYFEYNNEQIQSEILVEQIKQAYKSEGHRVSSIKSLRVYINPEERKAYYVINDKAEGKFVAF